MKDILNHKNENKKLNYKIMNIEPYNNYPVNNFQLLGNDRSYLDSMKSIIQLLNLFYDKYDVDKYEKNNKNILITID